MSEQILRIYDFDGTIYDGNSTWDFFCFLIKRHKQNLFFLPVFFVLFMFYKSNIITLLTLMERIIRILIFSDLDEEIKDFWDKHENKIKKFYSANKAPNDIIVSASPEPLLVPIAKKFGVRLVASKFDKKKKSFEGRVCFGAEKVRRLKEMDIHICDEFYTDSLSDAPMIKFAKASFLVKGESISKIWNKH